MPPTASSPCYPRSRCPAMRAPRSPHITSWRGEEGGIAAAKAGHDVVMAPQKPTYFDHYQSKDPKEPQAIGGHNSLADVYAYEPIPAALSRDEAARVLGAQSQIWTEWMP